PKRSRPAAVSCAGRACATTCRLRSSPQTDATIGTGSAATRLSRDTETGSRRASAARTARTPVSPSASPTASATSATMRSCSTNRPRDPRELDANGAEAIAEDAENGFAVHVPIGQEVDVRKRVLGPGVDAQMRLREEQDTGDGAVRKDRELLAHDTQG